MIRSSTYVALAFCAVALGFSAGALAEEPKLPDLVATPTGSALAQSIAKDKVCTECHDESDGHALTLYQTPHGLRADGRTPNCRDCHGESQAHVDNPTKADPRPLPEVVFGDSKDKHASAPAEQSKTCLGCHESSQRMHWKGSVHDNENVACTNCHEVHTANDPVLDKLTQTEVCLDCHKKKRAELHRPSAHPVLEGKVACSDCHNPHGSNGPTLLAAATLNETCYTCHAEKRGPFLWEHEPAREDCGLCHKPHGSVNDNLLKNRAPWLCQQCHLAQFHPSTAYSGTGLPGANTPSGAQQLLGKNCMNCHPQVHGSNHPSGVRKTR